MVDTLAPSLARLIALRVFLIAGWAAGLVWLHAVMGLRLSLAPLATVLGLLATFAVYAAWRQRRQPAVGEAEYFAHLLVDLTAFAVLVFFTGGATNPFVSLMLVPVVFAAVSLPARWAWLAAAVAAAYYLLLLFFYQPLAIADPMTAYGMHLAGMWMNFVASAALIAFFVTRIQAALAAREAMLAELRERQLRDERILALGTQAALAAHELATPLATIQTTAHELAAEFANDPEIGDACRLLERQSAVCKAILTDLAARAQDGAPAPQPLDAWLAGLVERWRLMRPEARLEARLPPDATPFLPPDGLEAALVNLLDNAFKAAPAHPVEFTVSHTPDRLRFAVADRGPGLRPSDPAPGKPAGWGMGLALTRAALERVGGRLELAARAGGGTEVQLSLPWKPAQP